MNKLIPFFLGIVAVFSAHSQSLTLNHIKESGIVKVGIRTNADPFSSYQNGQASGYMIDLCNIVVEDMQKSLNRKLNVQYVPVTPSNRFELVQNGQVDLECGTTTVNNKRREKVDFSYNTFITSTNFVTTAKNKSESPRDVYDKLVASGQKIAIMKGTSHEDIVLKLSLGKPGFVSYVNSIEEGLTKVHNGEVFAFVQDKVLLEKGIYNLKLDKKDFAFSQEALSVEPYSLMVKKGDTEMVNFVNSSLRKVYKNGQAKQIMSQWLEPKNIAVNFLTLDNLKTPSTENAVN